MERMRAEQAAYAKRAKFQRAEATRCRERRDWLGAIKADSLAREFRKERDAYAARAKEIKTQWSATWRKPASTLPSHEQGTENG